MSSTHLWFHDLVWTTEFFFLGSGSPTCLTSWLRGLVFHTCCTYMWSGRHGHALDSGHREPRNAPVWTFATLDPLHGLSLYLFTSSSNSVPWREGQGVAHNTWLFAIKWFASSSTQYYVLLLWDGTTSALSFTGKKLRDSGLSCQGHTASRRKSGRARGSDYKARS